MIVLESEIKILCNNHEVCPDVMFILQRMGFTHIRDVKDSSTFDIIAKRDFRNGEDAQKTIEEIFDKCKGKIHQVQHTTKNSGFF